MVSPRKENGNTPSTTIDVNRKARTPPRISPPPLKRQRMDPGIGDFSAPAYSKQVNRSLSTLDSSHQTTTDSQAKSHCKKPPLSDHKSRGERGWRIRDHEDSFMSKDMVLSDRPNSSSARVRTCRACHKIINKGFDPLVLCSACQRPYHEACRKPPLAPEANPTSWSCLKCTDSRKSTVLSTVQHHPKAQDLPLRVSHPATFKLPFNLISTKKGADSSAAALKSGPPAPTSSTGQKQAATNKYSTLKGLIRKDTAKHDQRTPLDLLQDDALDQLVADAIEPKPKPRDLGACTFRTEIPNTPDLRSSQLPLDSTAPQSSCFQGSMLSNPQGTGDSVEQLQGEKVSKFSALCCICKKQPVLGGNINKGVKCTRCKYKPEMLKDTIPETPVPMSTLPSSIEAVKPHSTALASPSSLWFQSGLFNPQTNKIFTKKVRPGDTSLVSRAQQEDLAQSEESLLEHGTQSESGALMHPEARPVPEQVIEYSNVPKETALLPLGANEDSAEKGSTTDAPDALIGGEVPNPDLRTFGANALEQVLQTEIASQVESLEMSTSPTEPRSVEHHELSAAQQLPHDDTESKEPSDQSAKRGVNDIEESSEPEEFASTPSQATNDQQDKITDTCSPVPAEQNGLVHVQSVPKDGRYTIRQLAALALLAADGDSCSAPQVQDWVARNFPKYRKGVGGWERSLQANLAGDDAFQARKIPGEKLRQYAFANATSRKQFKNLFKDYVAASDCSVEHPSSEMPVGNDAVDVQKSSVSIQNGRTQLPRINEPIPVTDTLNESPNPTGAEAHVNRTNDRLSNLHRSVRTPSVLIVNPPPIGNAIPAGDAQLATIREENDSHDFDGVFMPFESVRVFHPGEAPDHPGIKRETSFFKAFPELAKPAIERMSDVDIEKKVEEIKNRPSRKSKWGLRLALKRGRRRDIHDETDGKWKPPHSFTSHAQDGDGDDRQGIGGKQFLDDIFNLPKNPLLILHNEQLAFRDGTLVNGKLPRCRVVYKVGRKFGGENGELRL